MLRSKRLSPIKDIAKNKEKNAAQDLGRSLDRQKVEANKLEQLIQYRIEYLYQMEAQIKQGINGTKLQQYHQFLSKLDLAISHQQTVLDGSNKRVNHSKEQWQNKRSKAEAIGQVMDKMAEKEKKVFDKRESNQNDEMSTQAFIRRQNNHFAK